jgi:UDP-glucose 4-epimerase
VRYLMTGGAGFIGSHLTDALVARGHDVCVLDDFSTGRRENIEHLLDSSRVDLVEGSVLDADLVDECVEACDACLHLAAAVGVQLVVAQPLDSLLRNVRGTDNVISAAARHRRRLLFTSSSEIYGKDSAGPLHEESDRILGPPLKSRWAYANAKAFGESLAHSYHRELGSEMIVVRLFNTVGPRQRGTYGMVLPRFVRQAIRGDDLTVYGNGTQSRCFLHVLDAVQAMVLLLEGGMGVGRVFNVGSREETAIVELARRVIERTGSASKIRLVAYADAYEQGFEDLGRRMPDTTALCRLTGWAPARTVDDAIDDVVAYQQSATKQEGLTVAD